MFKNERFAARLSDRMDVGDTLVPLTADASADLAALLSDPEDYTYVLVSDERSYEVMKVKNVSGSIIAERGLEGTTPQLHGFGACIYTASPLIVAAVKDLICNYDCCPDGDCTCKEITFLGYSFPPAKNATPWEGQVYFSGDTPMTLGVQDAPTWMSASAQGTTITLSGTPNAAGNVTFSVAGSNCNGTKIVSKVLSLTIGA